MKKEIKEFINKKGGAKVLIGTIILIIIAIACIVLGYGFGSGWDVVARFFTSKWAVPFYIGIPLFVILILYIIKWSKTRGDN